MPLDDIVLLASDLHALSQWLLQCFSHYAVERISASIGTSSGGDSEAVRGAVTEASGRLKDTGVAVWQVVASRLSAECTAQLAVRAVAGRYRMTNRSAPSTPSSYVETIFAPLKSFFSQYETSTQSFAPRGVPPPAAAADAADADVQSTLPWDARIVEDVTAAFCLHVASVMETAKQMDSALSRRVRATTGKGAGAGASSDAPLTDSDKINLQLRLDVEAYAAVVESLHLSVPIPSMARLRAAVAPSTESG